MWTFNVTRGLLDKDGIFVSRNVYSGFGEGLNNPSLQMIRNVGPIPCGPWEVCGPPFTSTEHGKYCLRLEPKSGMETFGRVSFLIHGDEIEHPGEHLASHGCIVMDYVTRVRLYQSGDNNLEVIPGELEQS